MHSAKVIPYGHQWVDESDIQEVVKVLKSDWLTQGPKIKELEQSLCEYTGAKYAVVVSSGTAALHIACLSAGIKQGDKAITSPITFLASANCILYCDAKPVFADVQEGTANIDSMSIIRKIDKNTKAIIPVHYAGLPAEIEKIRNIARKNNLIVIEDACHALGAEHKGERIGKCKHSDMTIFSFHPVKSITMGEGGAITTNNKKLYEKLLMFRNHGIMRDKKRFRSVNSSSFSYGGWYYEMQELGFNYRITDFQCALGISQLKKVNKFVRRREGIAKRYSKAFKNNDFFDLPIENNDARPSWHLYPIRLKGKYKDRKKTIFSRLRQKKLWVQVHYIPVYWHPFYQRLGYKSGICPQAEYFYEREMSIPLYQSMSDRDVKYVIGTILKEFKAIK